MKRYLYTSIYHVYESIQVYTMDTVYVCDAHFYFSEGLGLAPLDLLTMWNKFDVPSVRDNWIALGNHS